MKETERVAVYVINTRQMILNLFDYEDEVTITTERLVLRLLDLDDAEDVFEIRGDIDTTSDAGVSCMNSLEDAKDYILDWGENSVAIVLGDEVIGLIESYTDNELMFDSTFLGYYMKKSHRGKGYMTEALTALKNELAREGHTDLMLWIFPGNVASERVAKKCGFSHLGGHIVDIGGYNQYVDFYG